MSGSYEESDSNAGFYYDLKFLMSLLYVIFIVVFIALMELLAFADFAVLNLIFLCIGAYLDLQEFAEVIVPRYGWKFSKNNYKIASTLLIISIFSILMGKYFLESELALRLPLFFFLSVGLMLIPTLVGFIFTLTCYLDIRSSLGFWRKDEEITRVFLKHSYFYRKIFGRKSAQKTVYGKS